MLRVLRVSTKESAFTMNHVYLNFAAIINIFFPLVMTIGLVGNIMVMMVILNIKDARSTSDVFLANLAIADIVFLLVSVPKQLIRVNSGRDIFALSEGTCKIVSFIKDTVFNASILNILAIGLERYYVVCKPLQAAYVCTKQRAYRICLLVWVLGALFSSPHFVIWSHRLESFINGTSKAECSISEEHFWETDLYIITNLSIFYCLPLIILILMFVAIARHLKQILLSTVNTAAIRHHRHMIKMLANIVFAFFICHLPLRLFHLLYVFPTSLSHSRPKLKGHYFLLSASLFMLYLHPVANPILYNFMSKKFRVGFKSISMAWCVDQRGMLEVQVLAEKPQT